MKTLLRFACAALMAATYSCQPANAQPLGPREATAAEAAAGVSSTTFISPRRQASGASGSSTITNDTATNATLYPVLVTANTGNLPLKVSSTRYGFNPSSGTLLLTNTGAGVDSINIAGTVDFGAVETLQTGGTSVLQFKDTGDSSLPLQFFCSSSGGAQIFSFGSGTVFLSANRFNVNGGVKPGATDPRFSIKSIATDNANGIPIYRLLDGGTNARASKMVKNVTGIANNTATTVLTINVPNNAATAVVRVNLIGALGAGGAIGADEATQAISYDIGISRTLGVAMNAVASTAYGSSGSVAVAGAATITVTAAITLNGEGVGVPNTASLKVTIARGSGSSTNHTCLVEAEVIDLTAVGITLN